MYEELFFIVQRFYKVCKNFKPQFMSTKIANRAPFIVFIALKSFLIGLSAINDHFGSKQLTEMRLHLSHRQLHLTLKTWRFSGSKPLIQPNFYLHHQYWFKRNYYAYHVTVD